MRKHEHTCSCGRRWTHKVRPESSHACPNCGKEVVEKTAFFAGGERISIRRRKTRKRKGRV